MATWEGIFLNGRYRIYLVAERFRPCMRPVRYSSKIILGLKKKMFVRTFESLNEDCIQNRLPLHCPQVAATQTSAVGVRWKLQLPSRGIETTVTAGSLLNDLLTKPARALTVLGALQNHEEGRRKVTSMPTWVNLSQGGSTLHSPEATAEKASKTSAGVRGKDPQPVVSGRRAKNLADILSSYKKTKKPKKRPRAKPAAEEPPKKKAKLLPGESSESEEFEETEEDEEEEPPSGDEEGEPPARDDDNEDETQETQIPDRGALPWAWLPLQQEAQWEREEECQFRSGAPGERRYPETSCSRRPNRAVPPQSIGSLQTTTLPCGILWGSIVLRPEATQRRRSAKTRRQWRRQTVACQLQVPGSRK